MIVTSQTTSTRKLARDFVRRVLRCPRVGQIVAAAARGGRTSKDWAVGRAGRAGGMAGLTLPGDRS